MARRPSHAAALCVLLVAAGLTGCQRQDTAELTVAAAASLEGVFTELAGPFENEHELRLRFSFAGSQELAAQIVQGAPYDVFASADTAQMTAVGARALDPVLFATNELALVVPAGNPAGVTGLGDLTAGDLTVVLCAEQVPCGAATARLMAATGEEIPADSLERDVTSVLTKVRMGEADAGIVYRTDALSARDDIETVPLPEGREAGIVNEYPVSALAEADDPALAGAFVSYMLSDVAQDALRKAGFGTPGPEDASS